jgi:hypothetical protein
MKHLFPLLLTIFSFSINAQSQVSWDTEISDSFLKASVYNNSTQDQICSRNIEISLMNEAGLIKGMKAVSFDNHIVKARTNYEFMIMSKDLNIGSLNIAEIVSQKQLFCIPASGSDKEVADAFVGALRNSDFATAQLYLSYAKNPLKLKVVDVSSSYFNIHEAAVSFELNHIETQKTTFALENLNSTSFQCESRASVKCGLTYFTESSASCGVAAYNVAEAKVCGCKTRKGGPCRGGCKCKTWKTCAHPNFGVRAYNTCAHPDHGVENVKSCFLKFNQTGALESCQQN